MLPPSDARTPSPVTSTGSGAVTWTTPVPDRLSDLDATYAMQERFGLGDVMVFLGSCIGAKNPTYPGQAACTMAIRSNGHGSETQADFHWNGEKWVAEPTASQDLLPYPDPRLAEWVK